MDGNRPTLSDDALDRELDAALNVAPSPEFVTRVRMRVASEPLAAPWWTSWKLVMAGACVVLLGVAVAVWSRLEPASPAGRSIATDRTLPPVVVEPAPPSTGVEPVSRGEATGRRRADRSTGEIVMTEVIVSADDRRSVDALLLAIQQRQLPALLPEEGSVDESLVPSPIAIADVIIEPVQISRLE